MFSAFCCLLLLFFVGSPIANAQSPSSATSTTPTAVESMPTDPAALLTLAAKVNGLQNVGSEPLHLKATYELLDDTGAVKETGTFEEYRISAKKYKLVYSSPSFNQTDYSTEGGLFRVGNPEWPDSPIMAAHNTLYSDFPSSEMISKSKLRLVDRNVGAARLKCVTMDSLKPELVGLTRVYCFNPSAPILRTEETFQGANQTLYNSIVSAQGAYIARDVSIFQLGKPRVRMHLDLLNLMPSMDGNILVPPHDAVEIPRRVMVGEAMKVGKIIRNLPSQYPAIARLARVQGTVVIQAVIGRDGKVIDLRAVSGPPMLIQAATDTVRQRVYEPYLLDGEPVEVVTQINVVFSLALMPPI